MKRLIWHIAGAMDLRHDLASHALFLDLDGTLIEIASTPGDVIVPSGLARLLGDVARSLGGGLAILTGRPIADVDRFLAPLMPIAAGVHGAEIRVLPFGAVEARAEPVDDAIVEAVRDVARREPGTIVELKPASIAIHYRLAPASEPRIEEALRRVLEEGPDHLILCRGRKVLEIVPRHVSKGAALEGFMALPAFRGRRPVMIGDDLSDLSAFEAAVRLGGNGLKVCGEQFSLAESDFASPADVRAWLEVLAERRAQ